MGWVGKFFNAMMNSLYASLGKNIEQGNFQPRPVEDSIIDMCYTTVYVDLGIAKKRKGSWAPIKKAAEGLSWLQFYPVQIGK